MSFLDRLQGCAQADLSPYRPFRCAGATLGYVAAGFAAALEDHPDVFCVSDAAVELNPALNGFEARTAALDGALRDLYEKGAIPHWRDEPYRVGVSFAAPALFDMERAAVPLFGVVGYGVHLNGFVRRGGRETGMWIGRRSLDREMSPGKLDQIVAGGQPAGLSLRDNLVKECAEEASIPESLARKAVPVGALGYCTERPEGLRRDVLFNFDLELPADFVPANTDGEICQFHLWPMDKVIETVRDGDDFKFNCSLVVIDFLIRRGFIEPDHPEYLDLLKGLGIPPSF